MTAFAKRFLFVVAVLQCASTRTFPQELTQPLGFWRVDPDAPPAYGGPGPVNTAGPPLDPTGYPNVDVSQDAGGFFQGEVSIEANPTNSNNLVAAWIDYRLDSKPGLGHAYSMDGGTNWTVGFFPHNIEGHTIQGDPVVAADNNGSFFVTFIAYGPSSYLGGIWLAKSTDGGVTWPLGLMRRLDPAGDEVFDDKPTIAIDRSVGLPTSNNIYVAWSHGPYAEDQALVDEQIWLARSTDGGDHFATAFVSDNHGGLQTGAFPVVDLNGVLYVGWTNNYRIYLDKSFDGGGTFGPDQVVFEVQRPTINRSYTFPYLASNPVTGALYMAWNGRPTASSNGSEIFFSRSADGGTSWSTPINVINNVPLGEAPNDQYYPFVAVNHSGDRVAVMYYDKSDFPANNLMHTKVSTSIDDGITFTKPVRISDYPSDPDASPVPLQNGVFFGDYNGMVYGSNHMKPGEFVVLWTDSHVGNPDAYVSRADIEMRVGGSISHNSILSGRVFVESNLTVASGSTLTIMPGTTIKIADGMQIRVDGSLIAIGTENDPIIFQPIIGHQWTGISLRNASSSVISFCNILGAQSGIGISPANPPTSVQYPNISHSLIRDCVVGINVFGGPADADQHRRISFNMIEKCYLGIYINQGGAACAPLFEDNLVRESGLRGIWVTGSKPVFYRNTIETSVGEGVYCDAAGNAEFGRNVRVLPEGSNIIRNNRGSSQISVFHANPFLGLVSNESNCYLLTGGLNRVYHNDDNSVRVRVAGGGSLVIADKTFWGWPILDTWFEEIDGAKVWRRCPLVPDQSPIEQLLAAAEELRSNGQLAEAISAYQSIIGNHPHSTEAAAALASLSDTYDVLVAETGDTTLRLTRIEYLEDQSVANPSDDAKLVAKLELARSYEAKGDWSDALVQYDEVLQNSSNIGLSAMVLRAKVDIYSARLSDFDAAQRSIDEMQSIGASSEYVTIARIDKALFSGEILSISGLGKSLTRSQTFVSNTPSRFSLEQNFPNPFNPTTEIWFKLGAPCNMSLKLFDMLGREIQTLVEGYRESGYYSARLDAKDLASGVYFYRLKTPTFVSVKEMLVLK